MQPFSYAVAVLLAGAHGLTQQSVDSIRAPEVRTSGTAQRTVDPDLATVSVQFSATGATPAEAGGHLAARADSLRRALATLGIPGIRSSIEDAGTGGAIGSRSSSARSASPALPRVPVIRGAIRCRTRATAPTIAWKSGFTT
jgi:hypothetical protein